MEQHIVIGKIVAPHGVRGEFRVMPLSEDPARYAHLKEIHLDDGRSFKVESLRPHKNVYLMKVTGVDDMDAAELLRGRTIVLRPEELPELPQGRFYVRDITGYQVVDPEGNPVGVLKDVYSPAAADIFVIAPPEGDDILVAAIRDNIKKIDTAHKVITVVLPEWI